jgi:signal transduction histidine kinase
MVSDRGKGIEPQLLPHIFDRFSHPDLSAGRSHGGLGFGLVIVKQLTDLHRGNVRAESAGKGLGATFTLELPLSPPVPVPA